MTENTSNTILVINDETDALELIAFILRQAGYKVLTAEHGIAGLTTAQNKVPDLIVSDVLMPDLDGIELTRRLRSLSQLKHTPIILVSAVHKNTESAVKGLEAGADDYIEVPFEPMHLVAKVTRLLERKRSEEERDRFFNVSTDMLCVAGSDGYYKRLNPAWEKTLGFTAEELMSKPYIEFVHPEDRENTYSVASELEEGRPTLTFDNRYLCKDGSYKWLSWKATPVDEQQLIYAVAHNVTHRKAYEQSLIESKEQVTNILESITDAFFALDRDWNFAYVNSEAERILSRSKEEIIGKNMWEEFPAAIESKFREKYHQVMNQRVLVEFSEFYPDPLNAWYEVRAYPSRDGISVYFRDITNQKQAEEALKKSEIQFRAIFDNSLDAILIADDNGKYLDANPAVCKLLGLSKEEITTRYIKDFSPAEFETEIEQAWKLFLELGSQRGEYGLTLPNGKIIEVEFAATANILPGQHLSILRDITERKHTEEQLRKADQRALAEYERLIERISRLSESLGTARDLKTIYRALNSFAHDSTSCTGMFISLFDPERQLRTPSYAFSEGGEEADLSKLPPMPMNDSPHSRAVKTGQVIITDDFQAVIQEQPAIHIGMERDPTMPQSSLVTPMSIMGRVIGAVELQSTKLAAFKKEHVTAMQMAANLTANAIENVRLLEQERLRACLKSLKKPENIGLELS
jgi:PAS domain S-box-containing protein